MIPMSSLHEYLLDGLENDNAKLRAELAEQREINEELRKLRDQLIIQREQQRRRAENAEKDRSDAEQALVEANDILADTERALNDANARLTNASASVDKGLNEVEATIDLLSVIAVVWGYKMARRGHKWEPADSMDLMWVISEWKRKAHRDSVKEPA